MIHLLHFFNTMNSGLVHLIQGLCAQILFEIRDYRWFVFTSFAFLFRKKLEKICLKKKPLVQDLIAYTYTCVRCTHIRIHVCRDLVHLASSGPPGV